MQQASPLPQRSLWRNRAYVILTGGRLISTLGSDVSALAFPLLIYALTHSALQMGILAALRFVPCLLFSLPAGAFVDRWDRKRIMIVCDSLRAIALGSVVIELATGSLSVWQLYVVTLVEGSFHVFFTLSQTACLPLVVPEECLLKASSQNSVMDGLADLIGPALGGTLFTAARMLPFLADAFSYVSSVISLMLIRVPFNKINEEVPDKPIIGQLTLGIREGFVWLWHQPLVRFLFFLTSGIDCVMAGTSLIVVVSAQRVHATPFAIGFILAGGTIGGLIGSAIAPQLRGRFGFARVATIALWSMTLAWPLYVLADSPLLLGLVTTLVFGTYSLYDVTQFSERLVLIPNTLQGRVNGIFRLLVYAGLAIGQLFKGALLQSLGTTSTVLLFVFPLVALAAIGTLGIYVRRIGGINR